MVYFIQQDLIDACLMFKIQDLSQNENDKQRLTERV